MILPIGDVQRPDKVPFVNYAFLAANIFVFFFLQIGIGSFASTNAYINYLRKWAFTPEFFYESTWKYLPTVFYSMFMHADIWHLFGNMLFLWIAGDNIEGRLGHIGYFFFYVTAGVVATLVHYLFNTASDIPSLGASGAISGVIGAYFILCAKNRIKVFYWIWFYIGVILVPARLAIGFWIFEQAIYALLERTGAVVGVAVWAHIGGLVFGLALIFLLKIIKIVTPQEVAVTYKSYKRPTAFFTRRHAPPPRAWESPYAKYSRQRDLFGPGPSAQAPPAFGTTQAGAIPMAGSTGADFTVIALKPWQANYEGVVDAVATAMALPFSTVSQRLGNKSGVLATQLDAARAKDLVEKLRQSGTPALALGKADLLDLPPTYSVDNVVVNTAGFTLYSGGRGLSKSYRDIFLVICGLVEGAGPAAPKPVVVDILLFEPWTRFRLAEGAGASPFSQAANIRSTAMQMMHHGGNLPVNRGIRTLLDGGDWTPVTFSSFEEFDRYSYWLVQVVNSKNRKLF